MDGLSGELARIDAFVRQHRKAEAVDMIFNLIVTYAKSKKFAEAEALREKLFEVDAMALVEIIKSAEIIEDEKRGNIEKRHMDIWKKLYDTLMPEESNTLYFSLKKTTVETGTVVFHQGRKNARLYFVDQGELKLVCHHEISEQLIRSVGPGTMAGGDTFFSISVCTSSLIASTRSTLRYLEHEDFAKWQTSMPTLSSKLENYFSKTTKDHELLREKGINRRLHPRIKLKGVLGFSVLNASGAAVSKPFKGHLLDISAGGLSFFNKITNAQLPQLLLGRRIKIGLAASAEDLRVEFQETGLVIAVIDHLFNNYSIHLKFEREVPESVIETARRISRIQATRT